jgi:hypothetical protein
MNNVTAMCDFIGYEIKDKHRMKKILEEEDLEAEPELEKVHEEEQPITITQ